MKAVAEYNRMLILQRKYELVKRITVNYHGDHEGYGLKIYLPIDLEHDFKSKIEAMIKEEIGKAAMAVSEAARAYAKAELAESEAE